MSDSREFRFRITAQDNYSRAIMRLEGELKALKMTLASMTATAGDFGLGTTSAMRALQQEVGQTSRALATLKLHMNDVNAQASMGASRLAAWYGGLNRAAEAAMLLSARSAPAILPVKRRSPEADEAATRLAVLRAEQDAERRAITEAQARKAQLANLRASEASALMAGEGAAQNLIGQHLSRKSASESASVFQQRFLAEKEAFDAETAELERVAKRQKDALDALDRRIREHQREQSRADQFAARHAPSESVAKHQREIAELDSLRNAEAAKTMTGEHAAQALIGQSLAYKSASDSAQVFKQKIQEEKEAFEAETRAMERAAKERNAALDAVMKKLKTYSAEQERADKFAARTAPRTNIRYVPVRDEKTGTVHLRVVDAAQATQGLRSFLSGINDTRDGVTGLTKAMGHLIPAFDEIVAGRRRQLFATMGATFRDLGLGAAAAVPAVAGLAAVMATLAIVHGAEAMGAFAQKTQAGAAAAGMSVSEFSKLQGALVLTGAKADSADVALRQFAKNVAEAVADPSSHAAQALQNFGFTQDEIANKARNLGGLFSELADKYNKFNDDAFKSENLQALFNRSLATAIPLLSKGSSGVENLKDEAKKLGITLDDETVKALIDTGQKVDYLVEHSVGAAIQAFIKWKPEIDAIIDGLSALITAIGKVVGWIGAMINAINHIPPASKWMPSLADTPDKDSTAPNKESTFSYYYHKLANIGKGGPRPYGLTDNVGTGGDTGTVVHPFAQSGRHEGVSGMPLPSMQPLVQPHEVEDQDYQNAVKEPKIRTGGRGAAAKAEREDYENFAAGERLKLSDARDNITQIEAIYNEWLQRAKTQYGENSRQYLNVLREMQDATTRFKMRAIGEFEQLASAMQRNRSLDVQLGRQGSDADNAQLAQTALTQTLQSTTAEISALKQVAAASKDNEEIQLEVNKKILELALQAKEKVVEYYRQINAEVINGTEKIAKFFTAMFDKIGSATESFVSKWIDIAFSTNFDTYGRRIHDYAHKIQSAVRELLMQGIQDAAKGGLNFAGGMAAKGLSQLFPSVASDSLGGVLGNVVGKGLTAVFPQLANLFGSTAAQAPTIAAITAQTASLTAAISASTTAIVGAISASGATGAAGSLGSSIFGGGIAKILGFEGGGIVPSAAGGYIVPGNIGSGGQLAVLHPREMVLPSGISQGLQTAIGQGGLRGGGNSINMTYAPTMNGPGPFATRSQAETFFRQHGDVMLGEARNLIRNGWRP